ncbi:hypothetical protein CAPTEDRAFT_209510 [Capitella teleta]|uniref:Endonuclease/exonuclease/phosphatase domain-containing protein n=1 Tax=Capitella teleta TaxID=283909 RepID=R7TMK8_CAPTE|nr:hypothetical protein CAPTEDRAFT_209510 [Capitella teleta]|eukprot:ELT92300.1 hypothetical protein CAPTEDRAFT_209510 [Capitella teleta]
MAGTNTLKLGTYNMKGHDARNTNPIGQLRNVVKHLRKIVNLLEDEVDDEVGLRIAAFNIQILGKAKMNKKEVVDVLLKQADAITGERTRKTYLNLRPMPQIRKWWKVIPQGTPSDNGKRPDNASWFCIAIHSQKGQVIPRYDIMLIQEIRDSSGTAIVDLLDQLNAQESNQYSMAISERLGRSNSKEQYAYLYRHNKVTFDDDFQYPDELNIFQRPPYCVKFSTDITDGLHEFFLVGVHTAPDMAETEVDALVEVFEAASLLWGTQDGIIMGDFNADCGYLTKTEWPSVSLRGDRRFNWLIPDETDTTTSSTDCAYDRIITTGRAMSRAIIPQSANVYRFDTILGLNESLTKAVSDHYPVEVNIFATGHRVNPYTTKEHLTIESTDAPCIEGVRTQIDDVIERGYQVTTNTANDRSTEEVTVQFGFRPDPLSAVVEFASRFPGLMSTGLTSATRESLQGFIQSSPQFYGNEAEVKIVFLGRCEMKIDVMYNV